VEPRGAPDSPTLEIAVVAGDEISVVALPPHGAVTLGRDAECEVRIDSRSVSRRHARLHLGPRLRLEDLGSANGTFVHDARSPTQTASTAPLRRLSRESFELAVGERANLGSVSIIVRRARGARSGGDGDGDGAIVVRTPAMRAVYDQAERAAASGISVLVLGETGVGKEVLARAIHDRSPRAARPYLELNCAALPASLLESELFGHEKNAFTGAAAARAGLLESADGGTVFLDEVGELPLAVQVKLLRVLEDRKVTRIGGRAARTLDVRFVAATNRELDVEIERGAFRRDLYFRLAGLTLSIPPLRERVEEIAPLAERFLAAASRTLDRRAPLRIAAEALEYLERYAWPGNVRELRNVMERAAVLAYGDEVLPADLPRQVTGVAPPAASRADTDAEASVALESSDTPEAAPPGDERQRILAALDACAGNQTRAAKLLGMSLRTLVNRLSAYGVARPRKRS
jgi:two-component system response regulator AtoC